MGVDVEMKVRTHRPLTDGELNDVRSKFIERFPEVEWETERGDRYPDLERDEWAAGGQVVALRTLQRFYGAGYERGHWPTIREMGDFLAVVFGETGEVRYGGDCGDTDWEALQPWADARAECEPLWEEFGNEPYRAYFRRFGRDRGEA